MTKKAGQITAAILFFLLFQAVDQVQAQDTLPQFSAIRRTGNRVLISWTNPYGNKIRQLSVQRSSDSSRLFKSIVTLPDPRMLKNGYVDSKSPDTLQFYRLYILLDSGRYIFSKAQRAVKYQPPAEKPAMPKAATSPAKPAADGNNQKTTVAPAGKPADKNGNSKTASSQTNNPPPATSANVKTGDSTTPISDNKKIDKPAEVAKQPEIIPERIYYIKRADTLKGNLPESKMKAFRDSVNLYTKDTLLSVVNDTIIIKPFVAKDVFVLSRYIFTDKSGLLHIELPDAARKSYRVRFYEEDKTFLFEVRDIRDQVLLLDKANFQHAGWFLFELLENDTIVEKNRFFIGKDF